jgi:phage antirepressor YoqD-like protein
MKQKFLILSEERTTETTEIEKEVLRYLKDKKQASFQELAKNIGIGQSEKMFFSYLLKVLISNGRIEDKPMNLDLGKGFLFTSIYELAVRESKH